MNKILIITIVIVMQVFAFQLVGAQVLSSYLVTCDADGCESNFDGSAIFNELDVKPLDTYTERVEVCNNNDDPIDFSFAVENYTDSIPAIGGVMWMMITEVGTNRIVMSPVLLSELENNGNIPIEAVAPDSCAKYEFAVSMDNVGNDYQNKTLQFDIGFGFDGAPADNNTPTPTPGEVMGETTTPTVTPIPSVQENEPSVLGQSLAQTGVNLLIPMLAGVYIVIATLVVRNKSQSSS
jgi:hypothetical protein